MITKNAKIIIPKNINKSDYLDYAAKQLKEECDKGWKIGGIIYSTTEDKTVVLYI